MPTNPIQVAEIVAHKRLEGINFTIKSAPLEKLFTLLSAGHTVSTSRRTARPPSLEEESTDRPPGAEPSRPLTDIYEGSARRYELDFVDNGIPRQLTGFNAGRFDTWGCLELIHNRGPRLNLSILTAVGTGSAEGASVLVPTVVSDKLLTDYTEGLKSAIRQLYIDYIGDRTHTIIITSEHVIS